MQKPDPVLDYEGTYDAKIECIDEPAEVNNGPGVCACESTKHPDTDSCAQLTIPRGSDFLDICERLQVGADWRNERNKNKVDGDLTPEEVPGIGLIRLDYPGDKQNGDTGSTRSYTSRFY